MSENPDDFPRLSDQRLLEIRKQVSWIRELLQISLVLAIVWFLRTEHVSEVVWVVSFAILAGLFWYLERKYEH
jgi:hypothetical protein